MNTWLALAGLLMAGGYGGGVTDADGEDFSEFWAEDFKNSRHLYAKTSDKDLYGATLPPSVIYDLAAPNTKDGSLEKTERVKYGDLSQASSSYPYNYGQVYKKKPVKELKKVEDYVSYSQSDQKQLEGYLKPLKHQQDQFTYGVFKPHVDVGDNIDISNGYEGNFNVVGNTHGERAIGSVSEEIPEDTRINSYNKARSKVRLLRGNGLQSRTKCRAGICRKKAKNTNRVYLRPNKRIKKIVYNY